MCRYGFTEYKLTYACFKCRKGFKHRLGKDLLSLKEQRIVKQDKLKKLLYKNSIIDQRTGIKEIICPDCENKMECLGRDLRLPKKDKIEEWLAIEDLKNNKFNFFTCGCNGIGIVPQNLQEAYQLIEQRRNKTEGEKLLEKLNEK